MKLTKNFSMAEFVHSDTAEQYNIINEPKEWQEENIKCLCYNILQPLRDWLKYPITITSGFRAIELNKRIGGSETSQHTKGQAVDFICNDNLTAFNYIKNKLEFDQLIFEFGNDSQPKWIHVSVKCCDNRKQVLRAIKEDGKTKYINFK